MLTTLKKLPTSIAYPENIPILLVSPDPADLPAFREILHHAQWNLHHVETVKQAERHVKQSAPSVIVCERDLPDGSWKNVLRCAAAVAASPLLLVVSRRADEALWTEALTLGGYDVLLKPLDKAEVARVVGMAWRHWWHQTSRAAARAAVAISVPA
jgi:DNA-binding response OmpR family regulator